MLRRIELKTIYREVITPVLSVAATKNSIVAYSITTRRTSEIREIRDGYLEFPSIFFAYNSLY